MGVEVFDGEVVVVFLLLLEPVCLDDLVLFFIIDLELFDDFMSSSHSNFCMMKRQHLL